MTGDPDTEDETLCHDLEACAERVLDDPDAYASEVVDYARRCLDCARQMLIRVRGTETPWS
ncbi:hypothetical protein [Caenispirillum bisanense]|uniref:Uncharacterized protein n=1 Tax=Caenispirillum bisanense TaxID=414052 RepID=A0A286GHA2_9PROT|nr:hypothetical protein [Caenispirillum bisanense]SOD94596.1 hypothetical protein SAMN05421508_10447 [Caenispirillum bisanense]